MPTRKAAWPWLLVILGAIAVVGAAVYGYSLLGTVGTGHLDTTPLGGQITFKPKGSYRANIFTTRPSPSFPGATCQAKTTDGQRVTLHDAAPYTVNAHYNVESTNGIHLSAGKTYLLTCGQPWDKGVFAVVEVSRATEVVSFAVGTAGLVSFMTGVAALVARRRRRLRLQPVPRRS